MNLHLDRRCFIRLIIFALAVPAVLITYLCMNYTRAVSAENALESSYLKNISNLSAYLENLDNALTKTIYCGTSAAFGEMTATVWREAGFAKDALASLPLSELDLENSYKLLSQVGDYAVSLNKTVSQGSQLSQEQLDQLYSLKEYTQSMRSQVVLIEDQLRTGAISLKKVSSSISGSSHQQALTLSDSAEEMEESLSDYPTLIYDGPFSDHINSTTPRMTQDQPEITKEEALEKAAAITGLSAQELFDQGDTAGNLPCYNFGNEEVSISITKQGGYLHYLMNSRIPEGSAISPEDAVAIGSQWLEQQGYDSMQESYYEINGNRITINYAYAQNGSILCYPDLIKLTVALDNGEVLEVEASGYLVSHQQRLELTPALTAEQAAQSLSQLLTVENSRLTVIPTSGQNEVFCWEFSCTSPKEEQVLVYVNAQTGAEEQILVVYTDENGTLTM